MNMNLIYLYRGPSYDVDDEINALRMSYPLGGQWPECAYNKYSYLPKAFMVPTNIYL